MDMERRTLEKQGKEYVLTVVDDEYKVTQIKRYSREEMFENYDLVMSTKAQLKGAITTTKNQLKGLKDVEDTEELRSFLKMLEQAQGLRKKQELESQLKSQEEQFEKTKDQERELVRVVPEVLRREKQQQ